jgi:DNA-binding GntR family transcriptional regulator
VNENDDRSSDGLHPEPTLASAVVAYVKDAILRGEFSPGSPLPEIPLARSVSASRTIVREALRSLSDLGLVVLHPRRGAFVASMSPQRVREIFTLRALLESFAIRLALTEGRIRRTELEGIEAQFEQMRKSVEGGDTYAMIESDMDFHWAVCSPCGHTILLDQLRGLQARTRQFIFFTKFYDSDAVSEVEAHMPILTAVRAYEPERAEAAMRDHIVSAGERLLVSMLSGNAEPEALPRRPAGPAPAIQAGR